MAVKERTRKKELLDNLIIREADPKDYSAIHQLEEHSFGAYIHDEELRLIVEKGFGQIYLAFDGNKLVGYQVVLYKQYGDPDGDVESFLQPILREARKTDNKVMHDDVHFDEQKQVYFHLIGTEPLYQNLGVSAKLKQYAINNMPAEQREKQRLVCIRINNLPSIRVNMKMLGVCMTSLKPIDASIIGSRETNFNATSDINVVPLLNPQEVTTREIFTDPQAMPSAAEFLIPVSNGEEPALAASNLTKLIENAFALGYVVRGVFKASELDMDGDSYFYCIRSK
jgi:hypothetical protein